MTNKLDIRIQGDPLLLFTNEAERFYITKQLYDLRDLMTRNATFTKQIDLPAVEANLTLLRQYFPQIGRFESSGVNYTPVDVFINDVPVVEDAFLFSATQNRTNKTITIVILGGDQSFFNQLSDRPVSALFPELITWDQATLTANSNASTFWCYPDTSWYSNQSFLEFQEGRSGSSDQFLGATDVSMSGLWLYLREALDRIFGSLNNLTTHLDQLDTTLLDQLAIACPATSILTSASQPAGVLTAVEETSNAIPELTYEKMTFPIVNNNPSGYWSVLDQQFVVPDPGLVYVTIQMSLAIRPYGDGPSGSNFVRLLRNGTTVQTWNLPSDAYDTRFYTLSYQQLVEIQTPNTTLALWCQTGVVEFSTTKVTYSNATFTVTTGALDTVIPLANIIPQMTQRDLVKNVLQLFNLVPYAVNRDIYFRYWEDIIDQAPQNLENQVAVDQDVVEGNTLDGYGRENTFNYADDDNVKRQDVNTSIPMDVEGAPEQVSKIQLMLSACDTSLIPPEDAAAITGRVSVPAYEFDYSEIRANNLLLNLGDQTLQTVSSNDLEPGDVITWQEASVWHRRRITAVISEVEAVMDSPAPATQTVTAWSIFKFSVNQTKVHLAKMQDNGIPMLVTSGSDPVTSVSPARGAFFPGELSWTDLVETYYGTLAKSIAKPWTLQVMIDLPVSQFKSINSLRPVWLSEFGDYFYLNKLEQYKAGKLTRAELIRIWSEPGTLSNVILEISPIQPLDLGIWNVGDPGLNGDFLVRNVGTVFSEVFFTVVEGSPAFQSDGSVELDPLQIAAAPVSFIGAAEVGTHLGRIQYWPSNNPLLPKSYRWVTARVVNYRYFVDQPFTPNEGVKLVEQYRVGDTTDSPPPFELPWKETDVLHSRLQVVGIESALRHEYIDEQTGNVLASWLAPGPNVDSVHELYTGQPIPGYTGGRITVKYTQVYNVVGLRGSTFEGVFYADYVKSRLQENLIGDDWRTLDLDLQYYDWVLDPNSASRNCLFMQGNRQSTTGAAAFWVLLYADSIRVQFKDTLDRQFFYNYPFPEGTPTTAKLGIKGTPTSIQIWIDDVLAGEHPVTQDVNLADLDGTFTAWGISQPDATVQSSTCQVKIGRCKLGIHTFPFNEGAGDAVVSDTGKVMQLFSWDPLNIPGIWTTN